MDIATHALTSYVLARGFFPRRRWPLIAGMVVAGTIADIDLLSVLFGPSACFATRRTATHSILGTVVVILLAIFFTRYLARKQSEPIYSLFLPLALAAAGHVLLDVFQSEGVALSWPFQPTRFAMDWLPPLDPWILGLLLVGIFFPELLRLVSSEIGAKNKSPRGRTGALLALTVIVLYITARAILHSGSIASVEPHSYHGESARNVGSFPDSFSLLTWHAVVETQSFLCLVEVPSGSGRSFDPESAQYFHKPEPSPELDTAQRSHTTQEYLRAVPFPGAVVARTDDGYEVVIRSMRDLAERQTRHRVDARILIDSKFAIVSQELAWAGDITLR
jgi:membrane-bound metal-dependent hydrolase YbcI (DUF457 family)